MDKQVRELEISIIPFNGHCEAALSLKQSQPGAGIASVKTTSQ
jgi:hypothetical protein